MSNIYNNGAYLAATRTWHAEDSPWKARQILRLLCANQLRPATVAEIGCGAGAILDTLAQQERMRDVRFTGYDISPQAIRLCEKIGRRNIEFHCLDPLAEEDSAFFDLLLVMDVVEHVPDYLGFMTRCKEKAHHQIYHIPLGVHVSSVLRNTLIRDRYTVGHIHYFSASSALAALQDTGHEIIDHCYTNAAFWAFSQKPTARTAPALLLRWLCAKVSVALASRLFGGFSLLVLTK